MYCGDVTVKQGRFVLAGGRRSPLLYWQDSMCRQKAARAGVCETEAEALRLLEASLEAVARSAYDAYRNASAVLESARQAAKSGCLYRYVEDGSDG